jgi:hypothetical protein
VVGIAGKRKPPEGGYTRIVILDL